MLALKPDERQENDVNLANSVSVQYQYDRITRIGDVLIACMLIALTLPLMAMVALAIKLDSPGPVLSRQEWLSFGSRRVQLLKFRTTVHEPQDNKRFWGQVTRVGQFLRWTRIDALPQLLNVLGGDLIIIGTRRR